MKRFFRSGAGVLRCTPIFVSAVLTIGLCHGQQGPAQDSKGGNGAMTFPNVRVVSAPKPTSSNLKPQNGQYAAIDPATGRLRPIEQDEVAALSQQQGFAAAARVAPRQPVYYGKGMVSLVLQPNELNYASAEIQPDGSIEFACTQGLKGKKISQAESPAAKEGRNEK